MVKLRKATTHYSITTYRAPGRLRRARKKTETDESLEEELEDVKAKVREIYCGMKQEEPKEEEGKKNGKEGQMKGEVKKEEPNNGKQEIRVEDTDSDEEDEEYDDEDEYSNESVWTSDEDSHCSEKSIRKCPDCCKLNFCRNTMERSIKAVEQEIHAKLVAGAYPPPIPLKDFLCHMEREEKECKKTVELKVEPVVESKKLPALKRGFFLNNPAKEVVVKKEEEEEKEVASAKVESKKSTSSKKSNKKAKKVVREASPEVIEVPIVKPRPVKCSLCSKDIFPMDEVYFKMTCQDECNLTLHKTCFQNSMSEQGFKKKRDYKDAICVTEGCNAHVVSVYQRDIHDVENLYIKCTETKPINKIHMASLKKEKAKSNKKENKKPTKVKPTPAGRLPSTPSKEEEKVTMTSELSEIGNISNNNVIHQQPLSDQTNHQQQATTTTMVESTPGIRQPQLSRPIHCDVDERSDVNVVPLVKKPDTQIVCKYAVSDSPTRVMPKTKTQKKKKIIPIDTPSRVNRSNQVNEYGADFHDYDPSVACFGYPSSSSEQTAVPNNWEEAMEIVHPIGESILAILKPNLLDLLCNTPPPELGDLPVDGLLDTIRLVFGENLTNEQFLWLEKIFKYPSNILFSFINNLEHFSISESNGQMFYRKLSHGPSFIKHNNGHQERDPFISEASPKDITFPRFDANPVMPNQFSNSPSNSPPSASFGGSSFNNMDSVNSSLQQDHNSFLSSNRSDPPHRNNVFDFIHDTSSSRSSRNHAMQDQRRVDKWFSSSSSNSPLPKDQSNSNNSNGLFYERHTSVGSNEGYQSCEHTPPIEESFGNMRMKDQQQRVNSTNNDEQYRRHLESAQNRVMDTLAKESADFKAQRDDLQTKMNSLSRKLRQLEFSNNSLEQANNSYKFANIEAECERKITTAASTIEHVSIIINKLETLDDSSCSEVVRILNSYQRKMNVYMRNLQKMSEDAHEKSDAALVDYPRTPQFPVEVEQFFQIFPSKEDVMKELPRMMSHIETLSKRRTLHVPDRVELGMMIKAVLGILGPNYTFEAMRSAVVQGLCMRPVNPRLTFTGQSNGEVQQNGHNNYSNDSKPSWKKPCGPTQSREINITNHECVICMESISRGKPMSCTFCEEPYHTQCIRTWLVEHPSCPRCKTNWPDPEYFPSLQ